MIVTLPNHKHPYAIVKPERRAEKLGDIRNADIIDLYKEHGAILFRGFDGSVDAFAALGDRFISGSVAKHDLSRQSATPDHRVQTVNEGGQEFYMHPEIGREPWKPDMALFNCQIAPWRQGQTTIVDGVTIVEQLLDKTRELLMSHNMQFTSFIAPEKLEKWLGLKNPDNDQLIAAGIKYSCIFRKDGEHYLRIYQTPSLHKPRFSEKLAFGNYLLFSRFHNQRTDYPTFEGGEIIPQFVCDELQRISQEQACAHSWRKGDTMMLDNTRFMHGRRAVTNQKRRLILARFGFVNFYDPTPEELAEQPWRESGVWLEVDWQ